MCTGHVRSHGDVFKRDGTVAGAEADERAGDLRYRHVVTRWRKKG
jgi:hypothetical protein